MGAGPAGGAARVVSDRVLTVPNALSALRLLLLPVFAVLLVRGADAWALAVLAVSSVTDHLDGRLARRFDQVTRLGQVLDPFADRLYVLTALLGLAWRGVVPWWLVVVLLARDALMVATLPVLARAGHSALPVHLLGKAGTFCLLVALPLLLLSRVSPPLADATHVLGGAAALWGAALYWTSGVLYLRQVRDVVRRG